MSEPVRIELGRLRQWLGFMDTMAKAAECLAESGAHKPHPVGWVNEYAHKAEFFREILQDFTTRTGFDRMEAMASLPDEAFVEFLPNDGLTGWIQRLGQLMAAELLEDLEPTGRRSTPELASRGRALSGCCAVARTSFLDMTGLREEEFTSLALPEDPGS